MKYKIQFLNDISKDQWVDFYNFMSLFGDFPENFESLEEAEKLQNELYKEIPKTAGRIKIVQYVPLEVI